MEYSESRIYLPGDDIRSIDWRVTARTGRVHTKLFHEERDRPVLFVVDLGGHMRFGTRRAFKSVVAAEATSLLAWTAAANGDRVGGLAFADGHTAESRIRGGRHGVLALFRTLAGFQEEAGPHASPKREGRPAPGPDRVTRDGTADASGSASAVGDRQDMQARETGGRNAIGGIEMALSRARRVARPGTLVIVVSDFSGLRDPVARQLAKLREHNDLLCVWIYDRLESVPPPPARYPIGDGLRATILDTRSDEVARALSRRFDTIETQITTVCSRGGAVLVRIRCGDDVPGVLRETLGRRVRRPGSRPARSAGFAAPRAPVAPPR